MDDYLRFRVELVGVKPRSTAAAQMQLPCDGTRRARHKERRTRLVSSALAPIEVTSYRCGMTSQLVVTSKTRVDRTVTMCAGLLSAGCATTTFTDDMALLRGSFGWAPSVSTTLDVTGTQPTWLGRSWNTVVADHSAFYDQDTLLDLGFGIGLAALSANSQLDRDIYEDAMPGWRTHELREYRDTVVDFGDGAYVMPALTAAALLAPTIGADSVGEFGERSLRAILIGTPPMLTLQRLTGAGRPDDPSNTTSSEWEPFEHSNGVSGHAFIGSVPLLTVARMQEDPIVDGICYVGSMVVAAARLQGSRHYFSQVALGWWIGFLSTGAVADASRGIALADGLSVQPHINGDGIGVMFLCRF